MKPYQLAALAAAFFSELSSSAPAPAPKPQHNYVSKYPQHPINMGYGDNYPKYWQNERYNPAEYPPLVVPRVPFYPAPYSQAWKPTDASAPGAQEVEVKMLQPYTPPYTPPHGFPTTKTPAKEAIQAYSQPRGARKAVGSGAADPAVKKNMGFGSGNEGASYTKIVNNPGQPKKSREEGVMANGQPDWQKFSYGVVSDSMDHRPDSGAAVEADRPAERKTNAMGKVQKLIGGNGGGTWHEHLAKRDTDSIAAWPEHIQAKAEKMMKSAAVMQDRGQSLMEGDQALHRQKSKTEAPKEVKEEKEEEEEEKKGMKIPEDLMDMDASRKKVVPGSGAKGRNSGPKEEKPQQKPQQKSQPASKGSQPASKGSSQPASKGSSQPASKGSSQRKNEEEDPMMKNELPPKSNQMKKPKAPKSQRPAATPAKSTPGKSKPARGGKAKKQPQSNSPSQSNGKKQPAAGKKPKKIDSLIKRDAIPEPEPEARKGVHSDDKKTTPPKSSKEEEKESKPKGNAASRAQEKKGGGKRPNISQARPKNPKNKNVAFEETIRQHFEDDYVDEVIQEMCVANDDESTGSLQKRQNRRVLPCGPPVTIRRILGAGEALPTPVNQASYVAPAYNPASYVAATPTPIAVASVAVAPVAAAAEYAEVDAAIQLSNGQVQVKAPWAVVTSIVNVEVPVPQYITLPAATHYVTVPGPTLTVDREVPVAVAGPTEVVSVDHLVERPVTRTVVQNVPYAVTQTQKVTLPAVTKTQMITKEIAYPVTRTQTQVQLETVFPEVHAIPREKEIVKEIEVVEVVQVPATVEVVNHVPVTKTILVCPGCDQSEGACGCGTFPSGPTPGANNNGGNGGNNGNGGNGNMDKANLAMDMAMSMSHGNINGMDINTHGNINGMDIKDIRNDGGNGMDMSYISSAHGLESVARTAEDMEAFVRKALPHEFMAAQ